jgi:hypothetical protein
MREVPNRPIMVAAHRIFVQIGMKFDQGRAVEVTPTLQFPERFAGRIRVYRHISPETPRVSEQYLSDFRVPAWTVVATRAYGSDSQHFDVQEVHDL